MTHRINYLRPVKGSATKTFVFDEKDNAWTLHKSYQAGKLFDGYSFKVDDIKAAFEIVEKYQNHPVFMIQGGFIDGLNLKNIVRVKREDKTDKETGEPIPPTLRDRELTLVCFDVDGYGSRGLKGVESIEMFITELPAPFWEADYIYQFSASYGLFSDELKCHLFFWLEKPASNTDIREWVISFNKEKKWGNVLDPAVFVATQPVYTQRRICSGAPDPIKDFLGLVLKSGKAEWSPPQAPQASKATPRPAPKKSSSSFSMADSVRDILTGKNFHNEINRLALSFMGKGMAAKEIKATIKGMMLAAKDNLTDPKRLQDWRERFNDIDRSVESAFNLVDNPSQEDLTAWLKAAPIEKVLKEFPGKTFKKNPTELKEIISIIAERSGRDKRELNKRVKAFSEQTKEQDLQQSRVEKLKDRQKRNIFEVMVNDHNYSEASARVAKIFKESRRWPQVFVHGTGLAYVDFDRIITIRQMAKKSKMEKAGETYCRIPTVRAFKKPYHDLIARLGMDIRFVKKKLGREVQCPEKLASVVALGNDKDHRELTGIVQCPFVQENWEIFEKQGYDSETGLFSMIEKKIPRPLQNANLAFKFLREEVLAEFPFKEELDAVVMIAAMMALMQRPLLAQDPAGMPGFGITAPVQSSGKTTLVNLATTAVLKNSVPASNFSSDEEELNKHILSLLREGHNCVLFDNIAQGTNVKSDTLAKAMSAEIFSGRLLGENRTLAVASSAIWFFTGNGILFSGDFSTRVYPVNLNPKMENPDTRFFKRDAILDWVLEKRTEILWALASIIKNGQEAPSLSTGSRFKIWDKYIRAPLFAVTAIDINRAISANKELDTDFINKKNLITRLYEDFNSGMFTSRAIIAQGYPSGVDNPPVAVGELLEDILGKYSTSAKSVGKLLSKMVDRTYGKLVLNRIDTDRAYWQIDCDEEVK